MTQTLLSVVVGSKLHGLDTPESDTDYAHVVISPLIDIVSPFRDDSTKHNIDGGSDEVKYELRHFCKLAVQGNPTVLEVLWSSKPTKHTLEGITLQTNKQRFLSARRVYDAHRGYAQSQRKRSEATCPSDKKRMGKAAAAYLRVLIQGIDLLREGTFNPNVFEGHPFFAQFMKAWKQGVTYEATFGTHGPWFENLERGLDEAYENTVLPAQADVDWIERYLLEAYMCHQEAHSYFVK